MNHHFIPNRLIYLILAILILSACASPQVQPTPILSSPTPLPPTATALPPTNTHQPPTNTSIPPSATLTPPPPSPTPEPTFTKLEGKVDVGGRKIYYTCYGEGSPTVVLDSGMWEDSGYWKSVMQGVARFTRICAYDRAGSGQSDPAPTTRTSLDWATDIYNFLTSAGLSGLYLVVGHSGGGMNMLVFANQYPQDVAGMVLVDPGVPDWVQQTLHSLPYKYTGEPWEVTNCRDIFKSYVSFWESSDMDGWDLATSGEQVRSISSLGDLPLIVITATGEEFCSGKSGDLVKKVWKDLHAKYAALSTKGKQVLTDTGHYVHTENPTLVVETILQVLEQARSD